MTGDIASRTVADIVRRGLGVSWSEAERLILARRIAVHGNLCLDPARRLREGDVVNVHAESRDKLPEADELEIVYEDRDLLVVNKPPGVTSVREPREKGLSKQRRDRQPTLDELLDKRLRKKAPPHKRHGPANRPLIFPVHRLDRDTSGLMIFAKTAPAELELNRQFKVHAVDRSYLAVVRNGSPGRQTITTQFVRDRGDGVRGSINSNAPAGQPTQRAVTHVEPAGRAGDLSIVACRLETGRTHQIRIHLAEIGHPICGDKTYGDRKETNRPPRQALHAATLAFDHPLTGKRLEFERDWPADICWWLKKQAFPRRGG